MHTQLSGCIEAINLCHKEGYYDKSPQAIGRLEALYASIFMPQDRSKISKNQYESSLSWERKLIELFESSSVDDIWPLVKQVEDDIIFNHLALYVIEKLISQQQIEASYAYIEQLKVLHIFKEEDNRYTGYRVLLKYYAEQADTGHFLEILKKSEPIKERYEIENCKTILVSETSKKHGWEAALTLCKHKKIGEKYTIAALLPVAETWNYEDMKQLFLDQPHLETEKNPVRTQLCVAAFCHQMRRKWDPLFFQEVFDLADQTDPSIKWGDCRMRDGLLLDIGLACQDIELVTKCKKAIKNNSIKKELTWQIDHLKKQKKQ
ncbi:hypothetical protein [Paenibacillus eucommiae]|uniref:HEAT repeat domain-containing protein n=1 Tax=Paenibacillus eucommiae TaxID=1355755 RepID=A0ABS4ISL2_9BACL|nr:hypothetical protein [Paenibacillus eucommiae]MBP1990562.1 hypothetical protein [Paenibacillus eucommiae]